MRDVERYKIGTLLSLLSAKADLTEKVQAKEEKLQRRGREATQSDINAFARS
jgi:hypothetical protein